jgi:hypothetical protein
MYCSSIEISSTSMKMCIQLNSATSCLKTVIHLFTSGKEP